MQRRGSVIGGIVGQAHVHQTRSASVSRVRKRLQGVGGCESMGDVKLSSCCFHVVLARVKF